MTTDSFAEDTRIFLVTGDLSDNRFLGRSTERAVAWARMSLA